jgi:pimeloyl-ACP methyl ester carboxylesterase
MPYLTLHDDRSIFYTDEGTGPAVLLIHGWTCDGSDWSWLIDDLSRDHHVIAADNRGHGRSSRAPDDYTPRRCAADSAELLDALGLSDVIVVGHSMGGIIASALAVDRPDLVSRLVLADPAYGREAALLEWLLGAIEGDAHAVAIATFESFYGERTPSWLPFWHRRRILGLPEDVVREVIVGAYRGAEGIGSLAEGEAYLRRRRVPILGVYAGASAALAEWDEGLDQDPHSEHVVWPEHGHFLHQEAPERFAQTLRTWLSRVDAATLATRSPRSPT